MKKIVLTILSALLLTGCTQVNNTATTESVNTYSNEEFTISFEYPSKWEVVDKQIVKGLVDGEVISIEEKFEHSVILKTERNSSIFFDYQSVGFNEYESKFESFETFEIDGEEYGGYSIEETALGNYPAKIYKEWGIELAGITYIVEKNGKFIKFNIDFELSEEEKNGLEEILNSLEFE